MRHSEEKQSVLLFHRYTVPGREKKCCGLNLASLNTTLQCPSLCTVCSLFTVHNTRPKPMSYLSLVPVITHSPTCSGWSRTQGGRVLGQNVRRGAMLHGGCGLSCSRGQEDTEFDHRGALITVTGLHSPFQTFKSKNEHSERRAGEGGSGSAASVVFLGRERIKTSTQIITSTSTHIQAHTHTHTHVTEFVG